VQGPHLTHLDECAAAPAAAAAARLAIVVAGPGGGRRRRRGRLGGGGRGEGGVEEVHEKVEGALVDVKAERLQLHPQPELARDGLDVQGDEGAVVARQRAAAVEAQEGEPPRWSLLLVRGLPLLLLAVQPVGDLQLPHRHRQPPLQLAPCDVSILLEL
jgi:hypothetical protein